MQPRRIVTVPLVTVALVALVATGATSACQSGTSSTTGSGPGGSPGGAGADGARSADGGPSGASGARSADGGPSGAGGATSATRDAGADAALTSPVFRLCGLTAANGPTCAGLDAYASCLDAHCNDPLARCFGSDGNSGVCADYSRCVLAASDTCHTSCAPDPGCQSCLSDAVSCIQASACAAPACPTTSTTPPPPETPDGGTPPLGTPPPIEGTCADLEACCATLPDANAQNACTQTLADARAKGGDADCAVVLTTYKAAGACGG